MSFLTKAMMKKIIRIISDAGASGRIPYTLVEASFSGSIPAGASDEMVLAVLPSGTGVALYFQKMKTQAFAFGLASQSANRWVLNSQSLVKTMVPVADYLEFGVAALVRSAVAIELVEGIRSAEVNDEDREHLETVLESEFGIAAGTEPRDTIVEVLKKDMSENPQLAPWAFSVGMASG